MYFISLGCNCYIKMYLSNHKFDIINIIEETMPFDYNMTYDLENINNILETLYKNKSYNTVFKNILYIQNDHEVVVNEQNNLQIIHYFHKNDLLTDVLDFPANINNINVDKLTEISNMFNRRFDRLYESLNNSNDIICLIRTDYHDRKFDRNELYNLTNILSKFNNKNLYLIYLNNQINDTDCYNNTNQINNEFCIPCFLYNYNLEEHYYKIKNNNFGDIINGVNNYFTNLKNNK
jgi:hypothetical protein